MKTTKSARLATPPPAPPPPSPPPATPRPALDSIERARLENLRTLVRYFDGPVALSRKLGYQNAAFIVQLASENYSRRITSKNARRIETKLGLADGLLDTDPALGRVRVALGLDDSTPPPGTTRSSSTSLEMAMQRNRSARVRLADVIRRVMELLGDKATPENVADITDETLYIAEMNDADPKTVMIQRIIDHKVK
ncbi:MAG: hypothetical protein ACOYBR_09575 [Fluviibacter sp.]